MRRICTEKCRGSALFGAVCPAVGHFGTPVPVVLAEALQAQGFKPVLGRPDSVLPGCPLLFASQVLCYINAAGLVLADAAQVIEKPLVRR